MGQPTGSEGQARRLELRKNLHDYERTAQMKIGYIGGPIAIAVGLVLGVVAAALGLETVRWLTILMVVLGAFLLALNYAAVDYYTRKAAHVQMELTATEPGSADPDVGNRLRLCVQCGRAIPFDSVHCPYCGHRFPT